MADPILLARGTRDHLLNLRMANRHGLVAGATGTGKTVTLRVMAEGFSRAGVPVVFADVKGDLAGLCAPGANDPRVVERAQKLGLTAFAGESFPVVFWDVFGEQGHPARTTVSEMGPLLMARLLGLNETQAGVLNLAFKVADDEGLLLLDLKDLRAMLAHVADNASELRTTYGNVSAASVGAIQRGLLSLEEQGGDRLLGEPALDLDDLMQTDPKGRGYVNVLAAEKLVRSPQVYATFLLWLMAELFERLPEVGDPEKPRLVFFFDEAHLLFDDASSALVDKVEQVIRLVRSKGVGIYFVTQSPLDVPDVVLGQLGNRVQHALRAFTPRDQKAVRAAAETFRTNPDLDTEKALTELGVGEALVSLLDEKGQPGIVDRALILPPISRLGTITPAERAAVLQSSPVRGIYDAPKDRESAYELLKARADRLTSEAAAAPPPAPRRTAAPPKSETEKIITAAATSTVRAVGSQLGRSLTRGLFGLLLGKRR